MDRETIAVYDAKASTIAGQHRAVEPALVYRLIAEHFHPRAPTADIGCGSGRDTAWLTGQGFPTVGYDASQGMLEQARAAYPQLQVHQAALPELEHIADEAFHNVLCNAVLMHVPRPEHERALRAFSRIMRPGGRLILTFRPSLGADEREADGRLFAVIAVENLDAILDAAGLELLRVEHGSDARPTVRWVAVVAGRHEGTRGRGV